MISYNYSISDCPKLSQRIIVQFWTNHNFWTISLWPHHLLLWGFVPKSFKTLLNLWNFLIYCFKLIFDFFVPEKKKVVESSLRSAQKKNLCVKKYLDVWPLFRQKKDSPLPSFFLFSEELSFLPLPYTDATAEAVKAPEKFLWWFGDNFLQDQPNLTIMSFQAIVIIKRPKLTNLS